MKTSPGVLRLLGSFGSFARVLPVSGAAFRRGRATTTEHRYAPPAAKFVFWIMISELSRISAALGFLRLSVSICLGGARARVCGATKRLPLRINLSFGWSVRPCESVPATPQRERGRGGRVDNGGGRGTRVRHQRRGSGALCAPPSSARRPGQDRGSCTGLMRHPDRTPRPISATPVAFLRQQAPCMRTSPGGWSRRMLQPGHQQERQSTRAARMRVVSRCSSYGVFGSLPPAGRVPQAMATGATRSDPRHLV
jgi:hypothetical protein